MPLRSATPSDLDVLWRLLDDIDAADGYYPLTEAAVLAVRQGEGRGVVVTDGGVIVGFVHRRHDGERFIVETAIHPDCRAVQAHLALQAAVGDLGASPVWLWASEIETLSAAHELGFVERRRLVQLVRSLPIDDRAVIAEGVVVETFRPGVDEGAFIAVNNAAFADHPDNADWDFAEMQDRMSRSWFDPQGVFIARLKGRPVGVVWTKRHARDVGEIYIIGVHPKAQGMGLGRALTLIGLDYQYREQGARQAMLYTEADNEAGRSLYASLGFDELRAQVGLTRF